MVIYVFLLEISSWAKKTLTVMHAITMNLTNKDLTGTQHMN